MREEHCETAHLSPAKRQHGLVRNPTDLWQEILSKSSVTIPGSDDTSKRFSRLKCQTEMALNSMQMQWVCEYPEIVLFTWRHSQNIPWQSFVSTHLSRQSVPFQRCQFALQRLCQASLGDLVLQFTVRGAAPLLLQRHHGADTRVHLEN